MTDFYSVLKSSIISRDLRSAADRREVYEQAREAMVRKLWSFEPPLSDEEIDARIGLFDDAVERIEADLEHSLAGGEPPHQRGRARQPERGQQTPPHRARQAYDRGAGQAGHPSVPIARQPRHIHESPAPAPAYEADSNLAPPHQSREIAHRVPARPQHEDIRERVAAARGINEPDEAWFTDQDRERPPRVSRSPAYADGPQYLPAAREAPAYEEAYHQSPYGDRGYREEIAREEPYRASPATDITPPASFDGYPAYDEGPYQAEDRAYLDYGVEPHTPEADWDYAATAETYDDEFEAPENHYEPVARQPRARRNQKSARRSRKSKQKKSRSPRRASGIGVGRVLAIIGGAVAAVLIVFNAYIFLPIILGSDPDRPVADTSPPKSDDRLPVAGTATAAARIASDSATATEIPERNLNVSESLVVFNGSDPTVFEGSSGNPIQFDSDSEGGFARISSATSAAGARTVIGPGLAEKLAGRTIRVTLLARSSSENGAAVLRFAYQSGLAISHWQNADLASNYSTYGIIWRVPATHTATGDYLLIEPGIPGDGTSTDIRLIKIDILAS